MRNVFIIGAGLAGSITAKLCRLAGAKVTVIDGEHDDSGSQAAACLMRPSWLTSLSGNEQAMAYTTLMKIARMQRLTFNTGVPGVKVDLDWVPPVELLVKPDIREEVKTAWEVGGGMNDVVLVAAGWRTSLFRGLPLPDMTPVMGVSLIFPGQMKEPRLKVWAPYRQAIAFNISESSIWFGDGTAIQHKNWNASKRVADTVRRAKELMGLVDPIAIQVGARPKLEGHPRGCLMKVSTNVWWMTGGYKNGTALYALLAKRFLGGVVCQ